jgi:hypothetical protein
MQKSVKMSICKTKSCQFVKLDFFEVKLGIGMHDEAALNLLKLRDVVDTRKISKPISLNIITGTGINYTRPDGVNVISISSLGV